MAKAVRDLTKLELAILAALSGKERYGLEILKVVEQTGQRVSLAGVYTTLARLEAEGLVGSHWGDDDVVVRRGARRRYYTIKGAGVRAFDSNRAVLRSVLRLAPGPARLAAERA
jgi:DNA-binding PadR family transcriptional regulator